ncbi:MAG: hypothetical protein APF80_10250, partial [Alphaproteobacteria bacterium BRH_c36]
MAATGTSMRYVLSRGSIHKDRHVLCREGAFYIFVPTEIRHRGPWQVLRRGNVKDLKPKFRSALARHGWLY